MKVTKKQEMFCEDYLQTKCVYNACFIADINNSKTYEKLYYVYFLINPLNNEIFYVGKGKGKRAEDHARENRTGRLSNHKKHEVINNLKKEGHEPEIFVFENQLKNSEVLNLEHLLILKFKKLITNNQSGSFDKHQKNIVWAKNMLSRGLPYDNWLALRPRSEFQKQIYKESIEELQIIASGEKKIYNQVRVTTKNGFSCMEKF